MTKRHKTESAAEYLGVPADTLKLWRFQNKGPRYRKLPNGKVDYAENDLDAFSNQHVVDPQKAA
jgi:hypothetical protein